MHKEGKKETRCYNIFRDCLRRRGGASNKTRRCALHNSGPQLCGSPLSRFQLKGRESQPRGRLFLPSPSPFFKTCTSFLPAFLGVMGARRGSTVGFFLLACGRDGRDAVVVSSRGVFAMGLPSPPPLSPFFFPYLANYCPTMYHDDWVFVYATTRTHEENEKKKTHLIISGENISFHVVSC